MKACHGKNMIYVVASASALLFLALLVHGHVKKPVEEVLSEFFWVQIHESADGCFMFQLKRKSPETNPGEWKYVLTCELRTDDGALFECQEALVAEEEWKNLEKELYGLELPDYKVSDPYVMDATDSRIELSWMKNGTCKKKRYDGAQAQNLFLFLKDLALQTAQPEKETELCRTRRNINVPAAAEP